MSRLSTKLHDAVNANHVVPFTLVELTFDPIKDANGTEIKQIARCTSLPFDLAWGVDDAGQQKIWSGVSTLGDISEIQEGPENKSYGITLTLGGVPQEQAAYLVSQKVQGNPAVIYLGFLNENVEIIGEPYVVYAGKMDVMDLKLGQESAVQISVESLLIDWERPRIRRFTDPDQRSKYPTDRGFEFVPEVASKQLKWGRA